MHLSVQSLVRLFENFTSVMYDVCTTSPWAIIKDLKSCWHQKMLQILSFPFVFRPKTAKSRFLDQCTEFFFGFTCCCDFLLFFLAICFFRGQSLNQSLRQKQGSGVGMGRSSLLVLKSEFYCKLNTAGIQITQLSTRSVQIPTKYIPTVCNDHNRTIFDFTMYIPLGIAKVHIFYFLFVTYL